MGFVHDQKLYLKTDTCEIVSKRYPISMTFTDISVEIDQAMSLSHVKGAALTMVTTFYGNPMVDRPELLSKEVLIHVAGEISLDDIQSPDKKFNTTEENPK